MLFLLAFPQLKCEESECGGRIYIFFLFNRLGHSKSRSGKSKDWKQLAQLEVASSMVRASTSLRGED